MMHKLKFIPSTGDQKKITILHSLLDKKTEGFSHSTRTTHLINSCVLYKFDEIWKEICK